ncbi:MAG: hypothetical protein PWP30_2167 [Eubacteriaceae bacterium]|nr:hypothetical protein [Eubacteriaceae bacterium]
MEEYEFTNVFKDRLKELIENSKYNQREVAEEIGISKQTISFYVNGKRLPDIDTVYKLCKFFKISSDYLLGLSDIKSMDIDIKEMSKETGLNDDSIERLKSLNKLIKVTRDVNKKSSLEYCDRIKGEIKEELINEIVKSHKLDNIDFLTVLNYLISCEGLFSSLDSILGYACEKKLIVNYREWAENFVKESLVYEDDLLKKAFGGNYDDYSRFEKMFIDNTVQAITDQIFSNEKSNGDTDFLSFAFYRKIQTWMEDIVRNLGAEIIQGKWYALHFEKVKSDFIYFYDVYLRQLKKNSEQEE